MLIQLIGADTRKTRKKKRRKAAILKELWLKSRPSRSVFHFLFFSIFSLWYFTN